MIASSGPLRDRSGVAAVRMPPFATAALTIAAGAAINVLVELSLVDAGDKGPEFISAFFTSGLGYALVFIAAACRLRAVVLPVVLAAIGVSGIATIHLLARLTTPGLLTVYGGVSADAPLGGDRMVTLVLGAIVGIPIGWLLRAGLRDSDPLPPPAALGLVPGGTIMLERGIDGLPEGRVLTVVAANRRTVRLRVNTTETTVRYDVLAATRWAIVARPFAAADGSAFADRAAVRAALAAAGHDAAGWVVTAVGPSGFVAVARAG